MLPVDTMRNRKLVVVPCLLVLLASCAASSSGVELAGETSATLSISETAPFSLENLSFSAFLTICDWTFQLTAGLSASVFSDLVVQAAGPLGDASLSSALTLEPATSSFVSWRFGAAVTLLDVDFVNTALFVVPFEDSYNELSISSSDESLAFTGRIRIGLCDVCFQEAVFCFTWPLEWCAVDASVCLAFNDAVGFESTTITLAGYTLFEDVSGVTGSFDVTFRFTPGDKVIQPSLTLAPEWLFCPELQLVGSIIFSGTPIRIDKVRLDGLLGEFTLVDGIILSIAESFVESANSGITGKAEYFEALKLTAPLPSCCGSPGSLSIGAYFERGPGPLSGMLFGWGLLEMSAALQLSEAIAFTTDIRYAAQAPRWGYALTVSVLW
jgi:hypothetical protein